MTPASALERALLQAQRGQLDDVETDLHDRLRHDAPESGLVREALAQGYLAAQRWTAAEQCADDILRRRPDHPFALVWRGQAREGKHADGQALADYRQALDLRPGADNVRLRLAELFVKLGRPGEARGHFEALHRRRPTDADVTLGLARCLYELHEIAQTELLLDELLAREHVRGLVDRGQMALHAGHADRAERWLRRAATLAPTDRDAQYALHLCLKALGRDAEAAAALDQVRLLETDAVRAHQLGDRIAETPGDPSLRYELGVLYLRNGQEETGVEWLRSALDVDPTHGPARAALDAYRQRTRKRGP